MKSRRTKRILGFPDLFWIGFVIMVGFFLKLVYDIEAGWTLSPHDLGVWQGEGWQPAGGVLGVIQYYYYMILPPAMDPRNLTCYAAPPLYFIFSAFLMGIFHWLMKWTASISIHVIQAFNVFYVEVAMGCGIGILRKFGVRGRKLVVSILLLTFFPALYNLSANLTPDAMCFMLTMLCLYAALSWYETRSGKMLTMTALALGLGLMCGYRTILVLPAVLVLFLSAWGDGRTERAVLRKHFRRFVFISGIMGGIWPLRQMILFRLTPFYMDPETESWRNLAEVDWMSRLALPTAGQMTTVHTTGNPSEISNIWAQLIKTAVFDEKALTLDLTGTRKLALILLYVTVTACIISHLMLVWALIANRREKIFVRFTFWGYIGLFVPFIIWCILHPSAGIVNFRFIPEAMIFPVLGMAKCGDRTEEDNLFERITSITAAYLIFVMAIVTAFLFGFYY